VTPRGATFERGALVFLLFVRQHASPLLKNRPVAWNTGDRGGADLKNQTDNLRLLIESVVADLAQRREDTELAETMHTWLVTLRERMAEVEEDTPEAFRKRRQLVRLLVKGITVGEKREDGHTEIRVTYRFDPPGVAEGRDVEDGVVGDVPNSVGYFSPKPTIRSNPMCANHRRATETTGGLSASRPRAARRPDAA
jgi:hypothetical protein